MDNYLTFDSKAKAEQAQREVFAEIANKYEGVGYTVINGEIVGKNNAGVDQLDAQRTTAWATVKDDKDGNFSFSDPEDAHAGTTAKIVDRTFTTRDKAEPLQPEAQP